MQDFKFEPLQEIDMGTVAPPVVSPKKSSRKKSKPTIHCVHIVDSSDSMISGQRRPNKYDNAVSGLKSEIEKLSKDDTANYTFTVIEFGGQGKLQTHFYKTDKVKMGVLNSMRNFRSMTALNDAVGLTLLKLKEDWNKEDQYLISILTDGGENDSVIYPPSNRYGRDTSNTTLNSIIEECKSLGFTITFMGVEADVDNIVNNYNITRSNTVTYDGTAAGLEFASNERTRSTMLYAKAVVSGQSVSEEFYTRPEATTIVAPQKKTRKSTKPVNSNV